jgi:hypothetical protein
MGLTKIMYWLAGADRSALEEVPSHDRRTYPSVGALVLTTAVLASLSSAYAFFTVFQRPIIAVLFGALWGFMILNLDRLILATFPKHENIARQCLHAAPRIGLALVISITIAHPLLLRLFEPEILDRIAGDTDLSRSVIEDKISEVHKQAARERERIENQGQAALQQEQSYLKDASAQEAECYQELSQCQTAGGCEPDYERRIRARCEQKRYAAQHARNFFDATRGSWTAKTAELENNLLRQENETVAELNRMLSHLDADANPSLLRRSDALSKIANEKSMAGRMVWFVYLLVFFLETTPVFVTIISPVDLVDLVVNKSRQVFKVRHIDAAAEKLARPPTVVKPDEPVKQTTILPKTQQPAEQATAPTKSEERVVTPTPQSKTGEGSRQPAAHGVGEGQAAQAGTDDRAKRATALPTVEERSDRSPVASKGNGQAAQPSAATRGNGQAKQPTNEIATPPPHQAPGARPQGGLGYRPQVPTVQFPRFVGFVSHKKGKTSTRQKVFVVGLTAAITGGTLLAGWPRVESIEAAILFVHLAPFLLLYEIRGESA